MTPEQINLVRLSFVGVLNIRQEAGRLFYERLFAIAPDTRALFKGDIESQGRKLMDTLALTVGSLTNPNGLERMLDGLAKRHAGYGVEDAHFDKVGEALMWTLQKGLGEAFTDEAAAAWAALYTQVAARMKQAGAARRAASA
jgi:nitric oxide dioxygenase